MSAVEFETRKTTYRILFNVCFLDCHPQKLILVIKQWKIRWFVLHEDKLICHHKKDKSVVIDTLRLQGASVTCPCYHEPDVNTECAFKLNIPSGQELLFQAAGTRDRDRWAHAIGAVIRSVSTANQVTNSPVNFEHFRVKANISEVLGALQDPDAGVQMASHVRDGTVHKHSFKGSEVIQWLLRWSIVQRRADGIALAQNLLNLGHLQEVDLADGTAGISQRFKDGEKLYRFTSLNLGIQRNSFFDSSDSDSSLSDDDDDVKAVDKVKKGKVVRIGFLQKKKSLRKGWRIVKMSLRENPPSLEYEPPYASTSVPQGVSQTSKFIDLQHCCLMKSSKTTTTIPADFKTKSAPPKLRLYVRSKGKKCRTFRTKDEEEYFDLLSALYSLCGIKPSAEQNSASV